MTKLLSLLVLTLWSSVIPMQLAATAAVRFLALHIEEGGGEGGGREGQADLALLLVAGMAFQCFLIMLASMRPGRQISRV